MSENILVVEYEPRYADRVRQALTDQPFHAEYARDGEEAIRALDGADPKLIVLSSVIPKVSAPDLIRLIRGRAPLMKTPILLTVSGYTGTSPKADAARMGASDILAKPYTESEFLGKVQQLLGVGQMTSSEIFGDVLNDSAIAHPGVKKPMKPTDDVDKMLEQTLAGVLSKKRDAKPRTAPGTSDLDKRLQDTLSGIEKDARRLSSPGHTPVPRPSTPAPAAPPVKQASVPPPAAAPAPAAREEEDPADGTRFGQYVLLEKIATGGMAEVWKARMSGVEGFQKIVAIKKILPHLSDNQEFIEMFVDEAKLAAQLNHSNIIHIYDLGKIGSSYYIAMEYVDGHDLKSILRRAEERSQPMAVEVALFVASKIAAALDYAHRKRDFDEHDLSLVHRDVSPQNVLISQEGDIKLCDFGIAKAATKASHTQVGALKGKLQYMSPEQASGKQIDRRSDIFALGTVLFEMLTGRKLFTGDNEISILEQVREARVVPPSQFNEEVSSSVDRVVFKALQKDPNERYQTAGEMARDIDSILYDLKPTPTSADLAIYMHRIWSEEAVAPPRVIEEPVVERRVDPTDLASVATPAKATAQSRVASTPPSAATPAAAAMPSWDARPVAKKRSPVMPIAIVAVVLAAIAGAFFYVRSTSPAKPVPPAMASAPQPARSLQPAPQTTMQASTLTSSAAPAAATTTVATTGTQPPALDPNLVDQEVQKRLAAERARLEQQARAAQSAPPPAASAATPPLGRRTTPVQQQPVRQEIPPPSQQTTQTTATVQQPPPPPPQATATEPAAVTTQAPAPVNEAPPRPVIRAGDLAAPGTEGLIAAKVLRRGTVPYPPLARAEHVQGTVICSVLISETGQVLQVRILRGIARGGLNEAAEQIMRRSTFSVPIVGGVPVKAWTTVPVEFKL